MLSDLYRLLPTQTNLLVKHHFRPVQTHYPPSSVRNSTFFGLDRLDLKLQRDERKDETLYTIMSNKECVLTDDSHLEILHKVVEYPQSFRILAILYIDQGTDFGGLEDG